MSLTDTGSTHSTIQSRVDELENHTRDYIAEFENLIAENLVLQSRLEDQENRDRRSNIRIMGIPETVIDLQATELALELLPGIPAERLEIDRVHRALSDSLWPT